MACKKDTLLKEECAKFRWSRAIASLVSLLQLCLCGCFVGSMFFLVGILLIRNFSSWVFLGSKFFSREYFVFPKIFLVSVSWVQFSLWWLSSWFKDFQFLTTWEGVTENRNIQIHLKLSISKSISTIASSIYTRKVLHLLNQLCY